MKDNEYRCEFTEKMEHKLIEAIAGIYVSMYLIHLPTDSFREIHSREDVRSLVNHIENATEQMRQIMTWMTSTGSQKDTLLFSELATLDQRMKHTNTISHEFFSSKGRWCRANFIVVDRENDGKIGNVIYAVQLIDEEKRRELLYQQALQQALENQNEVYGELLRMQSAGVLAIDAGTEEVLFMNHAALEIFGFHSLEEVGTSYHALRQRTIPEDRDAVESVFRKTLKTGEPFECEYAVDNGTGRVYVMAQTRQVILAGGGQVSLTTLTDMTERKQMMQELLIQSRTDALTGICNRGYGESQIQDFLAQGTAGVFALFDVDKFKSINDTYGHAMGDQVLITIADILKHNFDPDGVVMRLGGDEFAVFLPKIDSQEGAELQIRSFFKEVEEIRLEGLQDWSIEVSLGAVICEENSQKNFDEVYQMADSAMYRCKNTRGNQFYFYDGSC